MEHCDILEMTRAFFSQHKTQKECAGLNESISLFPVSPVNIPDPRITNTRVARKKHNLPHRLRALRSPKRTIKMTKCPCNELKGTADKSLEGLKKTSVSYPALPESVIQDASIRVMLALEDERGESNKSILDLRMRNFKRLFSTSDESKMSNPLLSSSARSSIVSIHNPYKEKHDKAKMGVAALLIKSIHSVPLENVHEDNETMASTPASDNMKEHENDTEEKYENQMKEDAYTNESIKSEIRAKKQHDSSFEENTSSSNNVSDESSIDSTSYNVLSDSKFSIDEELGTSNILIRRLTRTNTFPPLKPKLPKIRLPSRDSDTCPLQESTPPLFRCLSTNHIPYNAEFTVSSRIKKSKQRVRTMAINDASSKATSEFNTNVENKDLQRQEIHNSSDFDRPLATSTPEEIPPPFFPETEIKSITPVSEKREIPEIAVPENNENYVLSTTEYDTSTNLDNIGNLSYADDSEVSVSAYSLLQNASDTENKDKTIDEEKKYSSSLKEADSVAYKESFKNECLEKMEERNTKSTPELSSSTHSLPSLKQFKESTVQSNLRKKSRDTLASKTSSSAESLIQSSSNELYDVAHQNRQRRMLDLIKIIDTKMMVHPEHQTVSNGGRFKRKKRDRIHRNFNPQNLRKTLHNQYLRKHMRNYKNAEVVYSSPLSKDLPLDESAPPSIMTPDSSSYNSSLESIIIQSHLCRTESFHLDENVLTKRSTANLKSHEIAARELTVDTPSSDSLKCSSDIVEMKQLKPNDTNLSVSPASVDHVENNSHSIYNTEEISNHNEFTNITNTANMTYNSCVSHPSPNHRQQDEASLSPSYPLPAVPSMVSKVCQLPTTKAQPTVSLHRRSSDSDLSITPKGNSFGTNDKSMTGLLKTSTAVIRTMNQDAFEMLEYPFITMQQYPPGFILHIGGLVSSRSVKLLERISNLEEPESRDSWWKEVRMEVRSHARALACNVVIGYREETSICDDVCVLNAYGTAAVINFHNSNQDSDNVFISSKGQLGSGTNSAETEREKAQQKSVPIKVEKSDTDTSAPTSATQTGKVRHISESKDHEVQIHSKCSLCHLPYNESSVPFRVNVSKCAVCKRARVPDVMFTTIELPENLSTTGRGCIIQAIACKAKKDLRGELNAKEISDCLPFLEYELHSLLLNKLKVKGMNAIFGLKLQVSVGERLIIGMAVGTAVFVAALPTPSIPQIASGNSWHKEEQLAEIQKTLVETVKQNREFYRLKPVGDVENGRVTTSDTDESDDELPDLDFSVGPRDTCVLEVDDIEDMDRISLLMDDRPPDDFHVVNTQTIPGLDDLEIVRNLQMFTQISRTKIPAGQFASMPSKYFTKLLQSVYFKLRRMIPCALCDMQFKLALPEPDEIQFTVIGMALGLGEPLKINKSKKKPMSHSVSKDQVKKSDDSDMIFNIDVDHTEVSSDNASSSNINSSTLINAAALKIRTRSPLRSKVHTTYKHKHVPLKGRYGVDITPLSYLPGGRIERYLGNLNFFFIRESTSIRENGGLSGFTHSFVMEVLAIVRAHITALGGNAMVAFFMTKCVLLHSPHKNQGQCLINVGGDVVSVSYFADEKQTGALNC
nr:PREDICTED: uncharacterized protein LOC100880355 isoform X1 [Megachile rotundata]